MVQYVSNSSCRATITNKNTYWTIINFNFQTVITFFIFECYIRLYDFSFDFNFYIVFNIRILLTAFNTFTADDELTRHVIPHFKLP